jgi:hypothetical protein
MTPVPDNSQLDERQSRIQEKLSQLDSQFNTTKQFGFKGLLEESEAKERQLQGNTSGGDTTPAPTEDKPQASTDPPQWFGSLNTSLQTIRGELKNEIAQLRNNAPEAPPPEDENVSPELSPIIKTTRELGRGQMALALRVEESRAKDALRSARDKYKDFDFTEDELGQVWRSSVGNDANKAARIDWDDYFNTQYSTRQLPKLQRRNEELEKQISGKNNRNTVDDSYSVPRSNRALSTVTRDDNEGPVNEELYRRAAANMRRGSFIGFNKALMNEQRRMGLGA